MDLRRELVGSETRLVLEDGRVVQGTVSCIDSLMNIVMDGAVEVSPGTEDGAQGPEHVSPLHIGQVMAAGVHIVSIQTLEQE